MGHPCCERSLRKLYHLMRALKSFEGWIQSLHGKRREVFGVVRAGHTVGRIRVEVEVEIY